MKKGVQIILLAKESSCQDISNEKEKEWHYIKQQSPLHITRDLF